MEAAGVVLCAFVSKKAKCPWRQISWRFCGSLLPRKCQDLGDYFTPIGAVPTSWAQHLECWSQTNLCYTYVGSLYYTVLRRLSWLLENVFRLHQTQKNRYFLTKEHKSTDVRKEVLKVSLSAPSSLTTSPKGCTKEHSMVLHSSVAPAYPLAGSRVGRTTKFTIQHTETQHEVVYCKKT